jgi:hypothetical protein
MLISRVYLIQPNQSINRFTGKEMAASKNDDWCLVEIDFRICFPFEEVNTSISLVAALLTQIAWTIFPAETRALMAAFENLGASLIARKTIAWCRARH